MSITLREAWCKVAEWCENPPWSGDDQVRTDEEIKAISLQCINDTVIPNTDSQTLNIDCEAETPALEISGGNSVPLESLGTKTVYSWNTSPGFNYIEWDETAGPHLSPNEWDGPIHQATGYPLPTAAPPLISGVDNDANLSDAGNTDPNDAMRYAIYWGWVNLPANATIRDNNGNTGELGFISFGACCETLTEGPGGNPGPGAGDAFLLDPTPAPQGWVFVVARISDLSAFSGMQLQVSTDGTNFSNIAAANTSSITPQVATQQVTNCDEVEEPWQEEPLYPCCPPKPNLGGGGLSEEEVTALIPPAVNPATTLPIPDSDPGAVGTSALYSRADHIHPCAPNLPLLDWDDLRPTLVGPAEELQSANIRRNSTDRELKYDYRVRFIADSTVSGWVWLQAAPNPPGYVLSEFECHGVYYQTGSQDINTAGVTPYEEQYMGGNGVEWISGRLYYLHFSVARKFEDVNMYARVQATYQKVT